MTFQAHIEQRAGRHQLDGTVFVLADPAQGDRAEIWPAMGFNCYCWQVDESDQVHDLLFATPELFDDPVPTRSGIPILFPFPNRIRDGRFRWAGKDYQLPLIDSTKKNAIHGFACRHPWRYTGVGSDADQAWVRAEFQGSVDAPETRTLWPADYRIRITYRLFHRRLRWEIAVDNPDQTPLPFGLGFHPYFRIPLLAGGTPETSWVEAHARTYWQLQDSLPTGSRPAVDAGRDLNQPRRVSDLKLDDVLTGLNDAWAVSDSLCLRGRITTGSQPNRQGPGIGLYSSPWFRELVAFTPPHRQALCLEPYTCTTDAINLQQRGVDAGWLVLEPGKTWSAMVELRWEEMPV